MGTQAGEQIAVWSNTQQIVIPWEPKWALRSTRKVAIPMHAMATQVVASKVRDVLVCHFITRIVTDERIRRRAAKLL
jgi:hypothetical protein